MDYKKETLKEVKNWMDDDSISDNEKIEGIASMLFIELSEEKQIDMFIDNGDDFDFYIKLINNIDFDSYDGDCIREMNELIVDKFIKMKTFPSDKMKKQYILLNSLMK